MELKVDQRFWMRRLSSLINTIVRGLLTVFRILTEFCKCCSFTLFRNFESFFRENILVTHIHVQGYITRQA